MQDALQTHARDSSCSYQERSVRTGSARGCSLVSAAERQTCRRQRTHVLGSRRLGRWKAAPAGAAVLATRLQLCRGNMQRGGYGPLFGVLRVGFCMKLWLSAVNGCVITMVKCASLLPTASDPSVSPKQAVIIPAGGVYLVPRVARCREASSACAAPPPYMATCTFCRLASVAPTGAAAACWVTAVCWVVVCCVVTRWAWVAPAAAGAACCCT